MQKNSGPAARSPPLDAQRSENHASRAMPAALMLARRFLATLAAGSLLLGGCRQAPPAPAAQVADASASAPARAAPAAPVSGVPSSPALAPLTSPDPLVQLDVPGFGPATVSLPVGAGSPRPVVVALHGHAVRPEHACKNWSRASLGYAFVLCPHGLPADAPRDAAVTFGSAAATRSEIDAGMHQLRTRYGAYVAEGPAVFAGYSMGAKLGVQLVHEDPSAFPRAAFGEGGYDLLTPQVADDFANHGVRVLLLCSTKLCEPTFARVRKRLEDAGVAVHLASSGGTKHMFEGAVAEVARAQWPWLVERDPRWSSARPATP